MGARWVLAMGGVVVGALLASSRAGADMSKEQCVKANADGQATRNDEKLAEARTLFLKCGDASCPALVRTDCLQRLDELERAQPTIVFDVKDASGADVSAVSVTVDGKPLASRSTGTALRVDPGDHQFAFTQQGQPPIVRRYVIKEGEKDRRERIVLGQVASPPSPVPTPAPATGAPEPPEAPASTPSSAAPASTGETGGESSSWTSQRRLGLIAGGVGLVGVVVGGVFGLMTFSAANQQKSDCPQAGCANHDQALSDHSTAVTDGTISTVSFIAGGALLAVGAYLFLTAPPPAAEHPAARLIVMPSVGLATGGFSVRAEF